MTLRAALAALTALVLVAAAPARAASPTLIQPGADRGNATSWLLSFPGAPGVTAPWATLNPSTGAMQLLPGVIPFGNTGGTVAAGNDLRIPANVASVAALRALPYYLLADQTWASVTGYTTKADGGGGAFVWSATSTAADDGGTVINPTGNSGAGRWLRYSLSTWYDVRWFGADATGTADSTMAFRSTVATGHTVYAPWGKYLLTDAVTLNPGQMMTGDGRARTILTVPTNFNLSVQGVLVAATGEPGATVRDLWVRFSQPTSPASRAALIQYPPGISALNASRAHVEGVRVSQAMTCFDLTNAGGSFVIGNECSAFGSGSQGGFVVDGVKDAMHWTDNHFWNFDILGGSALYAIYADGTTNAAVIGRVDGFLNANFSSWKGNVAWTANACLSEDDQMFSNPMIDGGVLSVAAPACGANGIPSGVVTVQLNGGHVQGSAGTQPLLSVAGERVHLNGTTLADTNNTTCIVSVTNGFVSQVGGLEENDGTSQPIACVSGGGGLRTRNTGLVDHNASTAALVTQSGANSTLDMADDSFGGPGGVGVAVGTDTANLHIHEQAMGAYALSLPAGASAGDYGQPFTPSNDPSSVQIGGYSFAGVPANSDDASFGVAACGGGNNAAYSAGNNLCLGWRAGYALNTGSANVIAGAGAMAPATSATQDVAAGRNAGSGCTTCAAGTFFGYASGTKVTTANRFNIIGNSVGTATFATGTDVLLLGDDSGTDTPAAGTSHWMSIMRQTISGAVQTTSTSNDAALAVAGTLKANAGLIPPASTVAALPPCAAATQDRIYVVTDATAPSYRGALTGGGGVRALAYCDGSSWTAH